MIPIKDASSLPEEFSKPSTIQKHIIISEKQKTKQKYYQQNIESHTEKNKNYSRRNKPSPFLSIYYLYRPTCKSGFQFLNSEHHVATGKFILPCLLVTELK